MPSIFGGILDRAPPGTFYGTWRALRLMTSQRMHQDGRANGSSQVGLARTHIARLRLENEERYEVGQLPVRRPIYVNALTPLVIVATAALLTLGLIWASFRSAPPIAPAPAPVNSAATSDGSPRADRLTSLERSRESDAGMIRIQLEQLTEDGRGTKPFTHLLTRLAPPHASKVLVDGGIEQLARIPQSPPQRAIEAIPPVNTGRETLPHEIRFGASKAELPLQVSAFAASDDLYKDLSSARGADTNLTIAEKAIITFSAQRRIVVARAGDTLESILAALGATVQDASTIATMLMPHSSGRDTFAGGETISVLEKPTRGQVQDNLRPWQVSLSSNRRPERVAALSDSGTYVFAASRPNPASFARNIEQDRIPLSPRDDSSQSSMSLKERLLRLSNDKQIGRSLINQLLQLCAEDVDLESSISPTDTVEFLYSPSADGKSEVAFAALRLNKRIHRFYRFTAPDDNSTDYYDADGHSVTKALSHKPIANGRLGDGFGWRVHPILRDRRFHEGADYAAPFGSPIAAAGAGVVEKIDQQWGYGKYIRIHHDFGYQTTYAHISSVPPGIKVGARIHPGQTIAYVGSTGLSTGPHLYYELRVNGRYADPLQAHLHAGRVLSGEVLAAFQQARAQTDALLRAGSTGAAYE